MKIFGTGQSGRTLRVVADTSKAQVQVKCALPMQEISPIKEDGSSRMTGHSQRSTTVSEVKRKKEEVRVVGSLEGSVSPVPCIVKNENKVD